MIATCRYVSNEKIHHQHTKNISVRYYLQAIDECTKNRKKKKLIFNFNVCINVSKCLQFYVLIGLHSQWWIKLFSLLLFSETCIGEYYSFSKQFFSNKEDSAVKKLCLYLCMRLSLNICVIQSFECQCQSPIFIRTIELFTNV